MATFPHDEFGFNSWLVEQYFKHGTVEEAFRAHRYQLPVSVATYHRILNQFGVIKTAGPNNKLNEAVDFLSHMLYDNLSVEELYKKLPLRFQTSISSVYRIAEYVKEGLTRRVGVALVITPFDDKKKVLVANDLSTPNIELGKSYNLMTIPMGFARKRDSRKTNILRLLQNEVFTRRVIDKNFPSNLVKNTCEPFMYLDIADVRVAVFHLGFSEDESRLENYSSYKLTNFKFVDADDILRNKKAYRTGIAEATVGYKKYLSLLSRNLTVNPIQTQSVLNRELAAVEIELRN